MPRPEVPGRGPKVIAFKNPATEARIRINDEGMGSLTPSQREHMQVTAQMFTFLLCEAVNQDKLKAVGATPSNVFTHLRYRMRQVVSSLTDGSVTKDPAQSDPSPSIGIKAYTKDLSEATINFMEGVNTAKERTVKYARTVEAIADAIDRFKACPQTDEIRQAIEELETSMLALHNRSEGMDEVLSIIAGGEGMPYLNICKIS